MACVFCNRFKGTDIATILRETGRLCRLFNPRTDHWTDHFHLDGARIVGITDIGAATTSLLNFNHNDRLLERHALMAVDRYPTPAAQRRMHAR